MNIKIKPVGDRAMVCITQKETENSSGIIKIDDEQKVTRVDKGVVVAVGDGKQMADSDVLVGGTIFFKKFGGEEMELDGETYKILEYSDIIAIIE